MRTVKFLKSCLAGLLFGLLLDGPAMCLTPADVERYIEAGAALDLSNENLRDYSGENDFDQTLFNDERFMALLRGKLRVARCIEVMHSEDENEYSRNMLLETPGAIVALLCPNGQLLSPVGLAGRAVSKIVRPLELEQALLELPRYYEAIVNTPDWEKKFSKILSRDYASLERGVIFHLAGFPEMEHQPYYTQSISVGLADLSFDLDESDSSIEAWLYSFWLRRWYEGNMDAAKLVIDWLNKAIK